MTTKRWREEEKKLTIATQSTGNSFSLYWGGYDEIRCSEAFSDLFINEVHFSKSGIHWNIHIAGSIWTEAVTTHLSAGVTLGLR